MRQYVVTFPAMPRTINDSSDNLTIFQSFVYSHPSLVASFAFVNVTWFLERKHYYATSFKVIHRIAITFSRRRASCALLFMGSSAPKFAAR